MLAALGCRALSLFEQPDLYLAGQVDVGIPFSVLLEFGRSVFPALLHRLSDTLGVFLSVVLV
jgi:hypothetical protein